MSQRTRPSPRRGARRVAALGITAVVAVALAACTGDGSDSSTPSCAPVASPSLPDTAAADRAPDGGGLRIVEQGHTQVGHNGVTLSIGAVVENTSKQAAYRTRITFRPLDAHGRSAVADRSGELLRQEIPLILPGQRIGAGAWTYLRDDPAGRAVAVGTVQIELGAAHWVAPPAGNPRITTRHLRTERSAVEPESGAVHYTTESTYCQPLSGRGVVTLFRNGSGSLVGGSFEYDNSRPRCQPGTAEESMNAVRSIPPDIDDTRTTTYPYCDPAPAGPKTATDAPVN